MRITKRAVVGCLGVIGLALASTGTLVVVQWDAVSTALATQSERSQTTLFRWGELVSISDELKDQYGSEPEMAYDTATGERILTISFSVCSVPTGVMVADFAREIAAVAVGETTKAAQIDTIRVRLQTGAEFHSFALADLRPGAASE